MFWRQRLYLNFDVRVAVNVTTKMSVSRVTVKRPSPTTTRDLVPAHFSPSSNANKPFGGISLIFLINLCLLLLLSLCCDVMCKSNELPLTATATGGGGGGVAVNDVSAAAAVDHHINSNLTLNRIISNDDVDEDGEAANESSYITIGTVTRECWQRCLAEENLFLDEFGIKCSFGDTREKCFISRCAKGCEQWWRALKEFEPCQEACSSTQFYPFDLPCISACEMAQRHYWHLQRLSMEDLIGATTPQLLNDSLTANSLTLQWPITFPDNYLASRPFNIQYQYARETSNFSIEEADAPMQWSNLADYNCNENFDCEILEGLMPFTSYRFRFELPFGESSADVLYSPATKVFKTFSSGAPISMPIIKDAFPLDHSHVAVFWQPGQFANGPLKGYKLTLQNVKQNATLEKLLPSHVLSHIFDDLSPATNYTLQIAMLNEEGEGPFGECSIVTKALVKSNDLREMVNVVLIAGEYSIKLIGLEPLVDTKLIYHSELILSDYTFHMAMQRLYVVDAKGFIYSLFLDKPEERTLITLSQSLVNFRPMRVAVDWLNQRLFIAGETPGIAWTIACSDLEGNFIELAATNLTEPIQQLQADPINGWLFWTHSTGLSRLNLATKAFETILTNNQIGYMTNDFSRYLLLAHNKSDNELYELSYDGAYRRKFQINTTRTLQGEIQSFAHFGANILATNGTHLMRQNYHTNENDIWATRDLEWCWSVVPLLHPNQQQHHQTQQQQQPMQPLPLPEARPTHLQALLTSNMAKISWSAPPARTGFQSESAWQHWEYELEIMDVASNSAFNIRNIKTTYFNVEKLQANNLYKLRVRASVGRSAATAGDWSEELLTRTWPLGEHKFMWASSSGGGLYETNEVGAGALRIGEVENIRDFVQLNGTVYYITEDNRLQCANIMNPEVNCSFAATNAVSLAFDWRSGKLYWTDSMRNCVLRANLDGSESELLQIFGAQDIEIDAFKGHIYYTTGTKLARRSLSGTLETEDLEYFHVNGFGGTIRGFTLDVLQQQLYWIVRQNEGHVRLFKAGLDKTRHVYEDKLLEHDIEFGSLEYLSDIESLMWLQLNRSRVVLVRTDELKGQALVEVPELTRVHSVHLKRDYTRYIDSSVAPEAVDVSGIRIDDGYWDDFNIKWNSITAAENYTVFYKVLLQYGGDLKKPRFHTVEVTEPFIRCTEFHQPQLLLNISITPHTYWQAGPTVHAELRTPAAAPTQPKRLRIFVERLDPPLQLLPNVSALIRWDPPENVSLTSEVSYKVFCWQGEVLHAERMHNFSSDRALEASIDDLRIGETYIFQVQAFVAGRLSGGEKTAFHALHINPEVQSVPRLLYTTSEFIAELDLDLNSRRVLVHTTSEVEHLVTMQGEQRLLWVNENVELMSFVPGSKTVKLARMRAEVLSLAVDWISRIVYWAEMDTDVEHAVSIYKLDLCQFEGRVMLGSKILTTDQGRLVKDLIVLPFSQTLLWLEYDLGSTHAVIAGRNLTNFKAVKHRSSSLARMFEGSLTAESETVNVVDLNGKIWVVDLVRQMNNTLKVRFNVVSDGIADIDRDTGYFYVLKNDSIRAYNRRKQNLEYLVDISDVRKIKTLNYQQYPERKCLLPDDDHANVRLKPRIVGRGDNFIKLLLPEVNTNAQCWLDMPGLKYVVKIFDNENFTRNYTIMTKSINITDLQPFTNYSVQLQVFTYYQQRLGLPLLQPYDLVIRTAAGTPTEPQNFTVSALSPTEIDVSWSAPLQLNSDKVWYELHWQMQNSSIGAHKAVESMTQTLINLEPAQEYSIWLKVFSTNTKFNTSRRLTVQTFERPNPLHLMRRTAYNFTLSWLPSRNLTDAVLVCQPVNGLGNELTMPIGAHGTTHITIPDLEPKTKYAFYLELSYAAVTRSYNWPELLNERFVYETLGDSPSAPGQPGIEHITGEIFKVFWEPARGNGAPVLEYSLEALQARNPRRVRRDAPPASIESVYRNKTIAILSQLPWVEEPTPIEDTWIVYCNTTELSCIVRDLHTLRLLMFRVRARNEPYGWGRYSADSVRVSEPFVSQEKRNSLVFAIVAPAAIVSTCVIVLLVVRIVQSRRLKAKKLLEKSRPSIWSNFSTLQQQQLMASRHRAFSVTSHSTMYTGGPLSDADIALLPHISWNQITLLNFLGSGAFGEVYEGLMKYGEDDHEDGVSEKVAIKSLRKGASEFAELLQEAQLMSNFKHDNIVRLIGVCCDSESISIIMEHMEGGDLLSYLREARPNSSKPLASLQLLDLMTMCIDVATGCCYLEDMHFVHRDLACRNCLVSSRVPSKRVVKIGDFGLARDIYKNDYYRKEGEGLLPVRWMSPESLVDGVFTIPSDVWAFAVLCWEILTLGQQPYAARNNFEVLNFVKEGGRLEQPDNCPDKLFSLMLQCWNTDAEERPSFRKCLNTLLSIKTDVRRVSLGYNTDDADYAMYANHNGIILSSFLANPLGKVDEEDDTEDCVLQVDSLSSNGKSDLKVRFENVRKGAAGRDEVVSDESQLIERSEEKDDENTKCYTNEGVSRL